MCGRFSTADSGELLARLFLLAGVPPEYSPRYNVAPRQPALVVTQTAGERQAQMLQWGLVPFWAGDPSIGSKMINARGETVADRPAFRHAFRQRRCVVPATGFYAWQKQGNRRIPYFFRLRSRSPLAMAGLWEEWASPDGSLRTFTIITTSPNEIVAPIHNRMPVVLEPRNVDEWLDHTHFDPGRLRALLAPAAAKDMEGYRVSTLVNSPANDLPQCIDPVQP